MESLFFIEPYGRKVARWVDPWSDLADMDRLICTPRRAFSLRPVKRPAAGDLGEKRSKRVCCRDAKKAGLEDGRFRLALGTAGYRPEELSVQLADGVVTVRGRRRERSDGGFTTSKMVRKVTLPDHVQAGALTSRLTPAGQLILEAPVRTPLAVTSERSQTVPVTFDSPACKGGTEGKKGAEEENKTVQLAKAPVPPADQHNGADEGITSATREEPVVDDAEPVVEEPGPDIEEVTDAMEDAETEIDKDARAERQESEPAEGHDVAVADRTEERPVEVRLANGRLDDDTFRVSADVSQFEPHEVSVRVAGGVVTVEAAHEENFESGSRSVRLLRKFTLPEDVSAEQVTSRLTRSGQLLVEAPRGASETAVAEAVKADA